MPGVVDLCNDSSEEDDDVIYLGTDVTSMPASREKRRSLSNECSTSPSRKKAKLKHSAQDIIDIESKGRVGLKGHDHTAYFAVDGKSASSIVAKERNSKAGSSSILHRSNISRVYLNALGHDRARIRDGVIQGMRLCVKKPNKNSNIVLLCSCQATNNKYCSTLPGIRHIQQPDRNWSCGYRNTQMILSAILPLLHPQHSYYKTQSPPLQSSLELPSLLQLQQALEGAWKDGFDPDGARFYSHKVVGKSKWIGAVEAWSLLSYYDIDAEVVQFIKRHESRELLGPFCAAHFGRSPMVPCLACQPISTTEYAELLLQIAEQKACNSRQQQCECCSLPVYLQWDGHSTTLVGVEYGDNSTIPTHLLLLDPLASLDDSKPKSNLISRKPLTFFDKKDVQIVLASPRKREGTQKVCKAVTAGRNAVGRGLGL